MNAAPVPWVLAEAPGEAVARVCLGLTLYLDGCAGWARGGAARALRHFLDAIPEGALRWATTSAMGEWKRALGLGEWADALELRGFQRPRHLLWVRLVDEPSAPGCAFSYREVDDARTQRTGFLQALLPATFDPSALRRLAVAIAGCGAFRGGVAGHVLSFSVEHKAAAFWPAHAWARRYLGLDLQDPDAMSWRARSGLPGTSWLTLVGDGVAEAHGMARGDLLARRWSHGVLAQPLEGGVLLQAGALPDLGDLNALRYPFAYAEVARALEPLFVRDPPELWGEFWREKDTARWLRRLIDPEGWEG